MDELKTCPICGSKLTIHGPEDWKPTFYDPDSGGDPYNAVCDCGFQFSIGYCEYDEFIKALNRRPAPENKPLTLEQLRQMDGEPVKVVEDGEYQYGIVSLSGHFLAPKEEVITLCSGNFYLLREMVGNFDVYPVAYTRKPEKEEDHG